MVCAHGKKQCGHIKVCLKGFVKGIVLSILKIDKRDIVKNAGKQTVLVTTDLS